MLPAAAIVDLQQSLSLARSRVDRLTRMEEPDQPLQAARTRDAIEAVREHVGGGERVGRMWQRLCAMVVADEMLDEVHSLRQAFLDALSGYASALKELLRRVRLDAPESPEADALLPEIAAVEKLYARLSREWTDKEDLQELAVRDYPLPRSKLKAIVAKYPPPQEWYDE